MSRKFKRLFSLLNIVNGFSFTSCYMLSLVLFCYAEIAPLKQGNFQLTVILCIYMSPNQNALSLRAAQLKYVFSLRHIYVRYTIIHSITTLHKEMVG